MRPIDADRLLTEMMMSKYYHLPNGDIAIPIIDIKHAKTIDAVEVVRCENCTYGETATGWLSGYLWCVKDFETGCGQKMAKQKDDFCSFGERKTDETD